jgi:hypothetical protein
VTRASYSEVLRNCRILESLDGFDPRVVGTPPLSIDIESSDIDVICQAEDLARFALHLGATFGRYREFCVYQWVELPRAIIARFHAGGWPVQVYADPRPVEHQEAWRHFVVEQRLLALGGESVRNRLMELRSRGMKTEPAFANLLALPGDSYVSLLELGTESDTQLLQRIVSARARRDRP